MEKICYRISPEAPQKRLYLSVMKFYGFALKRDYTFFECWLRRLLTWMTAILPAGISTSILFERIACDELKLQPKKKEKIEIYHRLLVCAGGFIWKLHVNFLMMRKNFFPVEGPPACVQFNQNVTMRMRISILGPRVKTPCKY